MNNDLFEGQNKESIAVVQKKKMIVAWASDAGRHANNYTKLRNIGAIKLS